MGEISVKTGNNARNGGKNSLNRLIRCVCGKKIGPDPRNFNQRVSLGRNDLLIRTFPKQSTISGELTFRAIVTVALQRFKQKRGFLPADITIENTKKVTRILEKIHSKYAVKH
ncbi:hypothetical protein [Enterobacter ludwigii]|uniref:hypothetical protein n=1 Tax=Enterobacter ludwigii TaxID=299767 RepID=UPI004068BE17